MPASASLADPGLTDVPDHRHFIVTPNGQVLVGPNVCENPNLQNAFNQFHNNVHHSGAANKGPIGGAPGLDDGQGADLTFLGGCEDEL